MFLFREAAVANYATVQTEGSRQVRRGIEYYNLEAIFTIGYRVRSLSGIQGTKANGRCVGLFSREHRNETTRLAILTVEIIVMKKHTLISSLSIALFSGISAAGDSIYNGFEGSGPFGNPDHNGLQYPSTLVEPRPSGFETAASLHEYLRGNPDGYIGDIEGYVPIEADSGPTITSLDSFQHGNPDHDHTIDYSLPVIGSPEAIATAEAHRTGRSVSADAHGDGDV